MALAFRSECSCGFASEPSPLEVDAINAYRAHESGHAEGQRQGRIVTADAAPAEARALRKAAPQREPGPIH